MTAIDAEAQHIIPEGALPPHQPEHIGFLDRVRLGGDEPAICAAIDLSPHGEDGKGDARLVLMDVGFRPRDDGTFGPYDLTGMGDRRVFGSSYVLLREDKSGDKPEVKFFEVPVDQHIELGKTSGVAEALGYKGNKYISKKHASLWVSERGDITVTDEGSLNHTTLYDLDEIEAGVDERDHSGFGYTFSIADYVSRAGMDDHYIPKEEQAGWGHGMYGRGAPRPIIARDTPINGGVVFGGGTTEAIVIDDEKYPKELNEVYDKVLTTISANDFGIVMNGVGREVVFSGLSEYDRILRILKTVDRQVRAALRYDLEATDALGKHGQKISLNSYIYEGVGVCRTQAALSAYLTERLVKDGFLEGHPSIDRNMARKVDGIKGHAWMRFKDTHGRVYIIDPAKKYTGSLKNAKQRTDWDYRRTEDLVQDLL